VNKPTGGNNGDHATGPHPRRHSKIMDSSADAVHCPSVRG
jgi:hypothetical protein